MVLVWPVSPPVHLFTPNSAASPSQEWRTQPGQIPEAATFLSLRPGGHVLIPTVPSFDHRLYPFVGLEDTEAHTEALTKLPREALNESQPRLSFLNPDRLNQKSSPST